MCQVSMSSYFQDRDAQDADSSLTTNQISDKISKLFCFSPCAEVKSCGDKKDFKSIFGGDYKLSGPCPGDKRVLGSGTRGMFTRINTLNSQESSGIQKTKVSSTSPEIQKQKYKEDEKLRRIECDYEKYLGEVWSEYVEKNRNRSVGGDTRNGGESQPTTSPPRLLPAMTTSMSHGGQSTVMAGFHAGPPPEPLVDADQHQSPGAGRGRGLLRTPPVRLPGPQRRVNDPGANDPGGGKGGGSGGDGGQSNQQQQQQQPQTLVIQTSPTVWGVRGTPTAEKCLQSFYQRFNTLYSEIETTYSSIPPSQQFEWHDAEMAGGQWNQAAVNQQFFAMMVVHVCTRDLPGSHPYHGYIDFFDYDVNYKLEDASIDYSLKLCLSGVNFNNPLERFSSLDQLEPLPPEVNLRSGLIILMKMIDDIVNRSLKLTVEFTYDNGDAGPVITTFSPAYITDTLHKALTKVSFVLHNVFLAQHAAYLLADRLEGINDDNIGDLEELYCEMVTVDDADIVDRTRNMARRMMRISNEARKAYRTYEAAVSKVSEEGALTAATAQRVFADLDLLIRFLRNDWNESLPWAKAPQKFSTVKCLIMVRGSPLKITENPSRLMVPFAVTPVDASISRAKEVVEKVLDVLKTRENATSMGGPQQASRGPQTFQGPPKPAYPVKLLKDALYFKQSFSSSDVDEETQTYILEDFLMKTKEYVTQIQDCQWKYGITLSSDHCNLLDDLTKMKTMLTGMIKERDEERRRLENEQRELAKTLQVSKPVHLLPSGVNVGQYLFYHEQFKSSNKMSRVLKLRETLPRELLPRVENEVCPDAIIKLISDLFLNQDYLIPVARREVEKQRNCPRPHSDEERSSYNAIFGLIQRLKQAGLENKLDFTMMGMSLQKLSRVRQDSFEEKWLMKSIELEGKPMEVVEEEKRKLFVAFITLNENLLVRRQLQNSIMKADEEKGKGKVSKSEKAFSVRVTKHEKRVAKSAAASSYVPPQDKDSLQCPVCGEKGGHPRTRGARIGKSAKSVARCQKFRDMPQDQKLALIEQIGCSRCLTYGSHDSKGCQLPADTHWLQHDSCSEKAGAHHPSVCPSRPQASTSFGAQ